MVTTDKFNFFIPAELVKGTKPGQEMKIKGVCSSEVEDTDGEVLVPSGYDVTPLLTSGFINYNHQANKDASAIIGEATKAEIQNDGKDLYIEGFLYPDSDEAKKVYKLAQVLEKNSPNRRLGFSIEGKALEKDPLNPKRITKARITGVAITPMPKNPNTLLGLMKGEYSEPFVELDKEEEKEIDKAMTAAMGEGVTSKESVDGGKKKFDELQKDIKNSTLKKSEIYDKIFDKYKDFIKEDISKAQQVYQLTLHFNKKLYNMENDNVLSKALDNTFAFIDEHINLVKSQVENKDTDTLEKGELAEVGDVVNKNAENGGEIAPLSQQAGVTVAKGESEEDKEKVEKGIDSVFEKSLTVFIKSELEKGNTSDTIIDGMVMKGMDAEFCSTLVKGCVEEMSALKENGGETTTLQKGSEAAPVTDIISQEGETLKPVVLKEDFEKSLELVKGELTSTLTTTFQEGQIAFAQKLQSKFEAFGNIVKSLKNDLDLVKGDNSTLQSNLESLQKENSELQKSLDSTKLEVSNFAKIPTPLKSVTTVKPVERFENNNTIQKSQSSGRVFDLNVPAQANLLTDILSKEFQTQTKSGAIEKSDMSDPLGNTVYDLALTRKITNNNLAQIQDTLSKLNIQVVNNE